LSGRIYLKGSGSAGTVAPEFASILVGGDMAVTVVAADISNTASAGTSSSITVDTGDYAGIKIGGIIEIVSGTGVAGEQRGVIGLPGSDVVDVVPDWTTPPDATTVYSFKKSHIYAPASSALKHQTAYIYDHNSSVADDVLKKLLGAKGNLTFNMASGQPHNVDIEFLGQLVSPVDITDPGAATYQSTIAPPFLGGEVYLDGNAVKLAEARFETGSNLVMVQNPSQEFGADVANATNRRVAGSLVIPQQIRATLDPFLGWKTGATAAFWQRHGSVVGNRMATLAPAVLYGVKNDQDRDGYHYWGLDSQLTGEDTGFYLCFY
jgi:hypothetical protein